MRFEDLDAWKEARRLTGDVYGLTRQSELARDFGLCSQIQLAAVSTMSNIAEGSERSGIQEKLHFYNIAHASNGEVRSLTYVIEDNFAQCGEAASRLRESAMRVGSLLTGLTRSTESRRSKQPPFSLLPSPLSLSPAKLQYQHFMPDPFRLPASAFGETGLILSILSIMFILSKIAFRLRPLGFCVTSPPSFSLFPLCRICPSAFSLSLPTTPAVPVATLTPVHF